MGKFYDKVNDLAEQKGRNEAETGEGAEAGQVQLRGVLLKGHIMRTITTRTRAAAARNLSKNNAGKRL